MSLVIEPTQPVPLATGPDGVIRVAGTRVTLDTVAQAFERGATAEEIVQQYPVLPLGQVYSVLGSLLNHRETVETYLARRAQRHAKDCAENEGTLDLRGIGGQLVPRRSTSMRCTCMLDPAC